MRRCFVSIIILALLLGNVSEAKGQEKYLTRGEALQVIITRLYLDPSESISLFTDYYCVHPNLMHFVPDEKLMQKGYPVLFSVISSMPAAGFADVSSDSTNAIYVNIAKELKLVHGQTEDTFAPEKPISYDEVLKILVCARCQGIDITSKNTYPQFYRDNARQMRLINEDAYIGSAPLTDADLASLMDEYLSINADSLLFAQHFIPPASPEDCAIAYAKAVQARNGAFQYALMKTELQALLRDDFVNLGWVPGASSPWISHFEIKETEPLSFEIHMFTATSTGPFGEYKISIKVEKVDENYYISNLQSD